ncbi:alpha-L-fucosidase [Arthrobacter sp. SD76]|uniref:alpha-L-fucosidase n=1 Tax=Arthrobacter sp. SD76 TaxID=3415007 RepID=UPI003C750A6B
MTNESASPEEWQQLSRPTPEWFQNSPFGIFIHWGAYSVPAWAEPIGALGTIDDDRKWFTHNPYAEWYYNTIRIDGSPAQQYHKETYGGGDYDDFLDQWKAEQFDPADWVELFKFAGADYVVPTTKHHDGIALWDAPGTGERNTVRRGPRKDLIGEIASAVEAKGLKLGLYYSGGLDWHVRPFPPHITSESVHDTARPKDAGYAEYAYNHVVDLVDKYRPHVLWNDIEWPDAGKHFGGHGLGTLFQHFYSTNPEGVVNDRWGATHKDYATSEYEHSSQSESESQWENCRGIGFSFGYNQVEGPEQSLTGKQLARHLTDVVSRGGHFLLNVGPRADGTIPEIQRQALTDLGRWMANAKQYLVGGRPLEDAPAESQSDPWIRWVDRGTEVVAFVDSQGERAEAALELGPDRFALAKASLAGPGGSLDFDGQVLKVTLTADRLGPVIVRIPRG